MTQTMTLQMVALSFAKSKMDIPAFIMLGSLQFVLQSVEILGESVQKTVMTDQMMVWDVNSDAQQDQLLHITVQEERAQVQIHALNVEMEFKIPLRDVMMEILIQMMAALKIAYSNQVLTALHLLDH